jgi:two-component system, NarL family, sensor kinase
MSTEGNRTVLPGTEGRRRGRLFLTGRVRSWARLEVMAFFVVPLMVLAAVATATVIVSERIARTNALTNAESIARRFTQLLLAPLLGEALSGVPGRWEELDRIVSNRLSDGSITFLVVWSPDGQILYASVPQAVGDRYPPSEDLLAAVGGMVVSDVDEQPESSYQGRVTGPMVEVYVPVTSGGMSVVVEAYFSYDGIEEQAAVLRGEIIPLALGALVVLQLVQIPIATALARRVRRQETERAELLRRGLSASERDRRAIAGDVHDGPVQDLAGVSYGLSALRHKVPEENQANVDRMVGAVRRAVQSLRQLMVDLYPPDLTGPGLVASLEDLADRLRDEGLTVAVHATEMPELAPESAAMVYRTAKEALTNVSRHAQAKNVWLTLSPIEQYGVPAAMLTISDDGVGFPPTGTNRRSEGHLGLRLAVDRVRDLGGEMELSDRSGGGACVTAVIPAIPLA